MMPSHASAAHLHCMVALYTLLARVMCVASYNVIFSSLQSSTIVSIHRLFDLPLFLSSLSRSYLKGTHLAVVGINYLTHKTLETN